MEDADQVGQDRTYKDATDAYDAKHGKYNDKAANMTPEQALPNAGGGAPDPSPFKLGPTG